MEHPVSRQPAEAPSPAEVTTAALPCTPGGAGSDSPRLQQVGSAPSSLFFESLINFQETSPDNCHEAAPAKQTQTELSSTRLVT